MMVRIDVTAESWIELSECGVLYHDWGSRSLTKWIINRDELNKMINILLDAMMEKEDMDETLYVVSEKDKEEYEKKMNEIRQRWYELFDEIVNRY